MSFARGVAFVFRWLLVGCLLTSITAQATSTITYYHNDLTGSPLVATDASGHVLWRESYRPFGERLVNSAAAKGNDVWFTSRRQDVETGLVYMGARYYDPVAGRFVSIDPKGFSESSALSFNRYAYANNNPYKNVDPDGKESMAIRVQERAQIAYLKGQISEGQLKEVYQAQETGASVGLLLEGVATGIARIFERVGSEALSDSALVCRGGTCTADRFSSGNGVISDAEGKLNGVSVNSADGKSLNELSANIPNKRVGVTTVGDIRAAGGDVIKSPTARNVDHCTICGITAQKAEELFTPTVRNPNVP
jgi:RHS repeat-associated protein